jgi:CheY-like chemotaxis protein
MDPVLAARPKMRGTDVLRIAAIDDDALDLAQLQFYADKAIHPKCQLKTFATFDAAAVTITGEAPDLIILDDLLGGAPFADTAIARLRGQGYDGGIAVLSGFKRQGRNQHLVRAGAFYHIDKDTLTLASFMELIDMAMATGKLLRARRGTI